MANKIKDQEKKTYEKITGSKVGSFAFFIKYALINFIGLAILFPLVDFIKSSISHEQFNYNAISHIASPAIWAIILTILEVVWLKSGKKNKK